MSTLIKSTNNILFFIFLKFRVQNYFLLPYKNIFHNSISLKYYFFTKYKFPTYPHFFQKIPTQSLIKDKKTRDETRKRNFYIKIIYREPLLVPYTLVNTFGSHHGVGSATLVCPLGVAQTTPS
jgi:hypothetical protein